MNTNTNDTRFERGDLVRQAETIIHAAESANRDLTQAEITEFDRLMDKAESVKRRERLAAEQIYSSNPGPAPRWRWAVFADRQSRHPQPNLRTVTPRHASSV